MSKCSAGPPASTRAPRAARPHVAPGRSAIALGRVAAGAFGATPARREPAVPRTTTLPSAEAVPLLARPRAQVDAQRRIAAADAQLSRRRVPRASARSISRCPPRSSPRSSRSIVAGSAPDRLGRRSRRRRRRLRAARSRRSDRRTSASGPPGRSSWRSSGSAYDIPSSKLAEPCRPCAARRDWTDGHVAVVERRGLGQRSRVAPDGSVPSRLNSR